MDRGRTAYLSICLLTSLRTLRASRAFTGKLPPTKNPKYPIRICFVLFCLPLSPSPPLFIHPGYGTPPTDVWSHWTLTVFLVKQTKNRYNVTAGYHMVPFFGVRADAKSRVFLLYICRGVCSVLFAASFSQFSQAFQVRLLRSLCYFAHDSQCSEELHVGCQSQIPLTFPLSPMA